MEIIPQGVPIRHVTLDLRRLRDPENIRPLLVNPKEPFDFNLIFYQATRGLGYPVELVPTMREFGHAQITTDSLCRIVLEGIYNFELRWPYSERAGLVRLACTPFPTPIRMWLEGKTFDGKNPTHYIKYGNPYDTNQKQLRFMLPRTPEMRSDAERCFVRVYEEAERIDASLERIESIYNGDHPEEPISFSRAAGSFAEKFMTLPNEGGGRNHSQGRWNVIRLIPLAILHTIVNTGYKYWEAEEAKKDTRLYQELKAKAVLPITPEELCLLMRDAIWRIDNKVPHSLFERLY